MKEMQKDNSSGDKTSKDKLLLKDKPLKNSSLMRELWDFLKARKVWWLAPIIIMLILAGILIIFSQSSAVSPFIYALF